MWQPETTALPRASAYEYNTRNASIFLNANSYATSSRVVERKRIKGWS